MTLRSQRKPKLHSEASQKFAQNAITAAGILDEQTAERLFQAFATVQREDFLGGEPRSRAAEDVRLPIGFGQFSPRPSLIARMLALIGVAPGMRILEIGSGSGYTSALMASAGAQVYAVESIGLLAQQTRRHLDAVGYSSVLITTADGRRGWAEHAPYDAIVVWTPSDDVGAQLLSHLKHPGGRLAALIGSDEKATLTLFEAKAKEISKYSLEPVTLNVE